MEFSTFLPDNVFSLSLVLSSFFFFFLFFSTTRRPRYRVSPIDGNILYPQRLNAARNGDDRTPGRDSLENIYRFDGTI